MPPKSTPIDKKQTTLFGFFNKAPPSSSPSVRPAANGGASSSSASRPPPPKLASSSASKPATLAKAASGSNSKLGPASSSPLNRSSELQPLRKKVEPLAKLLPTPSSSAPSTQAGGALIDLSEDAEEEDEGDSQAVPTSDLPPSGSTQMQVDEDEDEDEDEHPVGRSARAKRKAPIIESDLSGTEDEAASAKPKKKLAGKGAKKPRKSAAKSDDEFELDEDDEDLLAAAAAEYDNYDVSESDATASSTSTVAPKKKAAPARKKVSAPSARPSIKPTQGGASNGGGASASGGGGGSSNAFLTQAEIRRAAEKQQKKDDMDCFDFLVDLRDADGNRPGDEDYDPRTLFIPKKAWAKFTPFETQFWEIKQNHFDTILFFQKGKFFELYENDARIGNSEFDLKLTDRVKMCMVGVPEQNFEMWAAKFLAAGYKVGRVEQAETALAMEMRQKASKGQKVTNNAEKIVRRELKKVLTNGTVSDATFLAGDDASHCIAIKETVNAAGQSSFGVVILDAATGAFSLSSFDDDIVKTKLETMFRQLQPKELIHEKGNLQVNTLRTLRTVLPSSCVWSSLRPSEFLEPEQTLARLGDFFASPQTEGEDAVMAGPLPGVLDGFKEDELVLRALGGLLSYLQQLNLDKDLLSQQNFDVYDPIRANKSLVLNGNTLAHIEVLVNSEGGTEGTLYSLLQKCVTPFGKRLFRVWLCHPLRDTAAINSRLDAVEEIMNHPTFLGDFKKLCRGLPDLERLVSRIHASNCRVTEFLKVLDAFTSVQRGLTKLSDLAESFESTSTSSLLRSAPDLSPHLDHIRSLFTYNKETDDVLPADGVDEAYEEVQQEIDRLEAQLEDIRRDHAKELGCREISYWHSAQGQKEIYQIQVPVKIKVPKSWTKTGGVKAFNRWASPETAPVIRELQEARETRTQVARAFIRRLLAEFDSDRDTWLLAVKIVGELDCLGSLAVASQELDEPKCRPAFIESDHAQVKFESLRHPAMCLRSDFIPNDVAMGGDQAKMVLLTGPNMAGKSTLLRTTAAGVIMAQLGMYVPAASAIISPVDAISTRMGAYDLLFGHASTFKVELDECAKILAEAGPRSLVILDELGRGTSTYDGMAIAGAVLHHLASKSLPLGFFATHYGSLTDDFAYHPNVRPMHMRTRVDEEKREVTFLYKLIDGKAESSHGTHVARLAGVPEEVVTRAEAVSHQFFDDQQTRVAGRRQSTLPLVAHTDFAFLLRLAQSGTADLPPGGAEVLRLLRRGVPHYEEASA